MASPFDLSQTLPVRGGFFVPPVSPGLPVLKQLTRMLTMLPGQGGPFPSGCLP